MILLGKRIKELRNKSKLTQTELAKQVGVTKSTIAAYENDSRSPSYEVLIKMANVFKVSIDSLLLNRSGAVLDVYGLNTEQLELIENIIAYFMDYFDSCWNYSCVFMAVCAKKRKSNRGSRKF